MSPDNPKPPSQRAIAAGLTALVLSIAGALVAKWEPARDLHVGYLDPVGVPTACYGHTGGVKVGQRYTDAQCDAWRRDDLAVAVFEVNRCIHVPLTAGQGAALADAAFNLGPAVVCDSTLQRLANAGAPPAQWCAQLKRWDRAGGRELTGLTHRRSDEFQLCIGGPTP